MNQTALSRFRFLAAGLLCLGMLPACVADPGPDPAAPRRGVAPPCPGDQRQRDRRHPADRDGARSREGDRGPRRRGNHRSQRHLQPHVECPLGRVPGRTARSRGRDRSLGAGRIPRGLRPVRRQRPAARSSSRPGDLRDQRRPQSGRRLVRLRHHRRRPGGRLLRDPLGRHLGTGRRRSRRGPGCDALGRGADPERRRASAATSAVSDGQPAADRVAHGHRDRGGHAGTWPLHRTRSSPR